MKHPLFGKAVFIQPLSCFTPPEAKRLVKSYGATCVVTDTTLADAIIFGPTRTYLDRPMGAGSNGYADAVSNVASDSEVWSEGDLHSWTQKASTTDNPLRPPYWTNQDSEMSNWTVGSWAMSPSRRFSRMHKVPKFVYAPIKQELVNSLSGPRPSLFDFDTPVDFVTSVVPQIDEATAGRAIVQVLIDLVHEKPDLAQLLIMSVGHAAYSVPSLAFSFDERSDLFTTPTLIQTVVRALEDQIDDSEGMSWFMVRSQECPPRYLAKLAQFPFFHDEFFDGTLPTIARHPRMTERTLLALYRSGATGPIVNFEAMCNTTSPKRLRASARAELYSDLESEGGFEANFMAEQLAAYSHDLGILSHLADTPEGRFLDIANGLISNAHLTKEIRAKAQEQLRHLSAMNSRRR